MGEFTNKTLGKAKKTFGKATGNRSLQAKGVVQETAGKVQGGARKVGRAVNRGINRTASRRPAPRTRKYAQTRGTKRNAIRDRY